MNNQPNLITQVLQPATAKSKKLYFWIGGGVLLIIIILALGALLWRTQHQLNKLQHDQQAQQDTSDANIIKQVGKLLVLPSDEQPTIATVSDLDKLKGQQFFAQAQLGDKVLIYSKAKKAILYRPSSNQIIELAPLLDGAPSAGSTATSSSSAK